MDDLDFPPTLDDVKKAIKQTSMSKASEIDGLPAKIFMAAGPETLNTFHNILTGIWNEEIMPNDFHDEINITLFKNNGKKANCENYHGISLMSIVGKILAWVILNCLISSVSEESTPESQCGFRPGCSIVDMVFSLRQVQNKCIEQHIDLYAVFIDLTKAFDTVNREALWFILTKHGCPKKSIHIIWLFCDGMIVLILSIVKQGCVLAPVLFNLLFTD